MALKVTFDMRASLMEQMAIARQVEEDIIRSMHFAGETFVKDARLMTKAQGGFGDITGNLRSSIGYFILKDGEVIHENLTGTPEGKSTARTQLYLVEKRKGLQLVGMAGMNYASAVESRGLNVISFQADICLVDLDIYYKDIERKYK